MSRPTQDPADMGENEADAVAELAVKFTAREMQLVRAPVLGVYLQTRAVAFSTVEILDVRVKVRICVPLPRVPLLIVANSVAMVVAGVLTCLSQR